MTSPAISGSNEASSDEEGEVILLQPPSVSTTPAKPALVESIPAESVLIESVIGSPSTSPVNTIPTSVIAEPAVSSSDSISESVSLSINEMKNSSSYSSDSLIANVSNKDELQAPKEIIKALIEHEQKTSIIEETESINLTPDADEPRLVRIGLSLTTTERASFIGLLTEFIDVFAWSYKDMPGIDRSVAEHTIPILPGFKPVKQKLRRMKPEWTLKIKEEIQKQLNAGFIKVTNYPEWVANIVPVPKKDGRIRVCVDYRDLNKASPKDDFPLPFIDILVDNAASHALFSCMDGYSGYNQIQMAEKDMLKTSFTTDWGTFYCTKMSFGMKNAGATYQRAATTIFHDMIHKEVEVYVDDMIVKTKDREGHIPALRKFFQRLRQFLMRLNPQKCAFGITSGMVLGFIVSTRGIEIDPSKIRAITQMPPPTTEKQIRGFLGKLQYISRFINKLSITCEPIFKKLRKHTKTEWDEECQEAFDKIKEYLSHPPILVPPRTDEPLIMYLTVTDTAMGAMLAQNQDGEERAIYYISRKFLDYETRYSEVEKSCIALIGATKKLRHYLLHSTIYVRSRMNPLKYLAEKPVLNGRIARWTLMLSEFDLKFEVIKTMKGRAVSDYLAEHPTLDPAISYELPDESLMIIEEESWQLYFDGAANQKGFGVGILLISPDGEHTPMSIKLDYQVTNNEAEYEACTIGLRAALEMDVSKLRVFGDSLLIINQISGQWKVKSEHLAPYQIHLDKLSQQFQNIQFNYLKREDNQFADALAKLASMINMPESINMMPVYVQRQEEPTHCEVFEISTPETDEWYKDVLNLLSKQIYPANSTPRARIALRKFASQFIQLRGTLYKRTMHGINLRCVGQAESNRIMESVHSGVCGPHMNGFMLSQKITRLGFYWTTMVHDCIEYVRKCAKCQIHANLQHVPPLPLQVFIPSWPFSAWGIDVIGKVTPKGTGGHEYILVAIDYFTKWVEAQSYAKLTAKHVARFIKNNIIARYGVPHEIISDHGSHFKKEVEKLLESFKIKHRRSSTYRPQTNGAVEAANKNIKQIIRKMTDTYSDWPDKLPFALWGYRTSIRSSTGATPYSLVYGMEAVLPIELEIPSLRIALESEISETDWIQSRYNQLVTIDEKRLQAMHSMHLYQKRMRRYFDQSVKSRNIHEGDLVLKEIRVPVMDPRGKFKPNWAGPYLVTKILSGGAVRLSNIDGQEFTQLVNLDQLKRFYT